MFYSDLNDIREDLNYKLPITQVPIIEEKFLSLSLLYSLFLVPSPSIFKPCFQQVLSLPTIMKTFERIFVQLRNQTKIF